MKIAAYVFLCILLGLLLAAVKAPLWAGVIAIVLLIAVIGLVEVI